MRSITVVLPVGVGVGEGAVPGVGLGVGDALGEGRELADVKEEPFPPHDASIRERASIAKQVWAACQSLIGTPIAKTVSVSGEGQCNTQRKILDYVESLRLGDYGVTGGHGRIGEWPTT
jgi:hypothetical protein